MIDAIWQYLRLPNGVELIFAFGYTTNDYQEIIDLFVQGKIIVAPLISHRISLDELPEMFERMRSPTDQIKVIVEP